MKYTTGTETPLFGKKNHPGVFWALPFLSGRRFGFVIGLGLLIMVLWPVSSAEISVPNIEMASRGWVNDGEFVFSSLLSADIALSGGNKYTFLLGLSMDAPDIAKAFAYRNFSFGYTYDDPVTGAEYNRLVDDMNDKLNNQAYIGFRIARATIRDLFGAPLEFSYFVGKDDDFCSSDYFSTRFNLSPFGSEFKGFFYFPEGIGGVPTRRYDGIYGVSGTGISLGLTKFKGFIPIIYLYQDFGSYAHMPSEIDGMIYSGDLRLLFYHNWLRLESFGGLSFNTDLDLCFRGGIMAHFDAGRGVEFFAQGGVPGFAMGEKFSIDNLFFLIEPRLHMGLFGMEVTFFYHPVVYNHVITADERGKANLNLKFLLGKRESGLSGGIEFGTLLKINGITEDFVLSISPLVYFVSDGVRWDAKIRVRPLEMQNPENVVDFFIGCRTAY